MDDHVSPKRMGKYKYTFDQVMAEAVEYKLVKFLNNNISLTELGEKAIEKYETEGQSSFNQFLFSQMEERYSAFRYILNICYEVALQ
jgi:hypothetical protein